jgi:exodeoxyribonuclease-5
MAAVVLNDGQKKARDQIMASVKARRWHVLTGFAGSGKTTLMQYIAQEIDKMPGACGVLSAPTHKAVSVLSRKNLSALPCVTIDSLLSLRPKVVRDKQVFERSKHAKPVTANVVIIDECSMIGEDRLGHIKRHLGHAAVIFVGDPAQLPPVGEKDSATFATPDKSHLETIVRQGAGNPILDAADILRSSQGKDADWSWAESRKAERHGVFRPADPDGWMRKAFTSPQFDTDADTHRYLCWTNAKVAEVNAKVRQWRYGQTDAPFSVGERCLARAPIVEDDEILLNTNEESTVLEIHRASSLVQVKDDGEYEGWLQEIPVWRMKILRDTGEKLDVDMPDEAAFARVQKRLADEQRWHSYHQTKGRFAVLQAVYALTVHNSQGSTFGNAFLDIPEMRRWHRAALTEAQRGAYVALTRASNTVTLIGA